MDLYEGKVKLSVGEWGEVTSHSSRDIDNAVEHGCQSRGSLFGTAG